MKLKKLVQLMAIGCSIVALTACSSMGKKNGQMGDVNDIDGSNGVQTAGAGDDAAFGGAGGDHGLAKRTFYFNFDRSEVRDEDKPAIAANANKLSAQQHQKVLVEGHTDPRGSREYNVALGERRANSVSEMLKSRGVNPSQVRVISYGAERPAAQGHSESAFQQDRRAVLVYGN